MSVSKANLTNSNLNLKICEVLLPNIFNVGKRDASFLREVLSGGKRMKFGRALFYICRFAIGRNVACAWTSVLLRSSKNDEHDFAVGGQCVY